MYAKGQLLKARIPHQDENVSLANDLPNLPYLEVFQFDIVRDYFLLLVVSFVL